jgi:hypothetical protein
LQAGQRIFVPVNESGKTPLRPQLGHVIDRDMVSLKRLE